MRPNDHRESAAEIFNAGLQAVDPYKAVSLHTERTREVFRDGNFRRLLVTGFGKAACPMLKALEDSIGDIIDAGIVITKYGHYEKKSPEHRTQNTDSKIKIYEAAHPVPDENGVRGTDELITMLRGADEHTLVMCLVSGGGSALLVSPYDGITLNEKQEITQLLLKAGAGINDLNCVRKHISKVKGGRLAEIAYPAKVISLILSDVIGDNLDVIASGPTSPDSATYNDALDVIRKYGLHDKVPRTIMDVLSQGAAGLLPDTPKEGNVIFRKTENIIIGSNRIALDAARQKAEETGYDTEIISAGLTGEAREVAKWLAEKSRRRGGEEVQKGRRPSCLIAGGETTVTVKGNGLGGRNTEMALAFALEIDGVDGITFLSAGTDGTDGPTDAAGAIVNGETIRKARAAGLDPFEYLNNNDSYNFFKKADGLIITGPTGTNVMDLQIVLLD
ncbi:MAG: glycerate kinase [Nitrospiraceae bacterium]|nr:MAG: glycerate kinase [Nitrospiraceae bacterium]